MSDEKKVESREDAAKRPYVSKEILDAIDQSAKDRAKQLGSINLAEFYVGAMAALYALGYQFPPRYVFGIMRGEIGDLEIVGKSGKAKIKKGVAA